MRGVIVIIAFVLCGCATEMATTQWTRPSGRSHDLPVDLYICEQWSKEPNSPNGLHMTALHQCMAARGWQETAAAR